MLPNFFLVGAPKAGTTSLYHYLDQHPQIDMSPIKEPCYFSDEVRPENFCESLQPQIRSGVEKVEDYVAGDMAQKRFGGPVVRWETYCRLFRNANTPAIGEASVCYLWSATAAQNIARVIPNAKILIVLRDPVERAYSQFRDMRSHGIAATSFRELIEANLRDSGGPITAAHPLLELGLYHRQLQRYFELFPRTNIQIHTYPDFRDHPQDALRSVFEFLCVDPAFTPDLSRRHREAAAAAPMEPSDRAFLEGYYAEDTSLWRALIATAAV